MELESHRRCRERRWRQRIGGELVRSVPGPSAHRRRRRRPRRRHVLHRIVVRSLTTRRWPADDTASRTPGRPVAAAPSSSGAATVSSMIELASSELGGGFRYCLGCRRVERKEELGWSSIGSYRYGVEVGAGSGLLHVCNRGGAMVAFSELRSLLFW